MAYPIIIKPGTSPHMKVGQGNPVEGTGSQKQTKESETAPSPTFAVAQEDQAAQPYLCRGPRSDTRARAP